MALPDFENLNYAPEYTKTDDFHANITIQFGQLVNSGWFDYLNDETWKFDYYSEEQYLRFCKKFINHYFWHEIGVLPLLRWKMEYLRKMDEIMPKYKLLYKALEDGDVIPLAESSIYRKSRNIDSDFPQTLLSGNSDYASYGSDYESEEIHQGSTIEKVSDFKQFYKDVDVLIIEELEFLFSPLISASTNGF